MPVPINDEHTDGALRQALLDEAQSLLDLYGAMDPALHTAYSVPVNALKSGQPWRLHRWELPFDHPEREDVGDLTDDLVLGTDDVLRPADSGQ